MILDVLDGMASQLESATGHPATADPAAPPPSHNGPRILVWDEGWRWIDGRCPGLVEATLIVAVLAAGTEKGQVRAMRDAHDDVAAAIPPGWSLQQSDPAEVRNLPAYTLRIVAEFTIREDAP